MDISLENIYIYPHDLELGVYEQVIQNPDDSYTILVNSRYNHETQVKAYLHALEHIRCHDFEKTDVQQIEEAAHAVTPILTGQDRTELISRFEERKQAYIKRCEQEHKKNQRLLRRYQKERDRFSPDIWNEMKLAEYEQHKADPEWKLYK